MKHLKTYLCSATFAAESALSLPVIPIWLDHQYNLTFLCTVWMKPINHIMMSPLGQQGIQCEFRVTKNIKCISLCSILYIATNIPKASESSNIPGWNMHVEESKKTSLFWHDLWRINGSPRQGTIADIMRRTRAKYHYAIRFVKCMSETVKKKQWLEQFLKRAVVAPP